MSTIILNIQHIFCAHLQIFLIWQNNAEFFKKIFKKPLTNTIPMCIINTVVGNKYLRVCWNWQTGTFEGRVFHDVRVQVPSLAARDRAGRFALSFPAVTFLSYDRLIFRAVNESNTKASSCTEMVQPFFVYGGQEKSAVGISHKMRISVDSVCGGLRLFSIRL